MDNFRINLRYATALFENAQEKGMVEETYNDVRLVSGVCEENRELKLLLKSPVIFGDKKLKILNLIFKEKIGIVTWTFIAILVKKRREEYLTGISNAFIDIYRESKGIKVARVTSAVAMDDSIRTELTNLLKQQTKSEILLEEKVDPEILGGLIVKIEGFKFDDSIRKKILDLKQEFKVNTYVKGY